MGGFFVVLVVVVVGEDLVVGAFVGGLDGVAFVSVVVVSGRIGHNGKSSYSTTFVVLADMMSGGTDICIAKGCRGVA
ncbi:hypothetical protein B0T20DRAFT_412107 [Sordaria brevicollis]|uniref:Uncharacterized protein n=1 Tax=Sordaria brevicollis TaxID=83679 RepID=A0AAE0UCW4_SORBR|nr:hypothetical protein B0T20DRAFT_412107 [Sordaria brevicollis]